MSTHIYTGPWVNWSHGLVAGATITVSDRSGGLLTSFFATFITLVSVQLWKILCFVFHQVRSTDTPQDGLHHQQQVIWRNAATPGSTAWTFAQQWWHWRYRAHRSIWRTLPWAIFAVVYLMAFSLAAIFSADISKAPGSARLVIGQKCGYWVIDSASDMARNAYNTMVTNQTLVAAAYARACYGGSHDSLNCDRLPVSELTWTAETNASCPFASAMCKTAAYKMTTKLIDSHADLGINAPPHNRIQVQHSTTCAPLNAARYIEKVQGTDMLANDTLSQLNFGPIVDGDEVINEYTWVYNTHMNFIQRGYSVDAKLAMAGGPSAWLPTNSLNRTDADVSLITIAANNVNFFEKCYDPVFFATRVNMTMPVAGSEWIVWISDYDYVPIGCVDQYRLCNPKNRQCSPYLGILQLTNWNLAHSETVLGFNSVQSVATIRVMDALVMTPIFMQVSARGSASLRAGETLNEGFQLPLPPDQWVIEVRSWFEIALAQLQQKVLQYATGPTNVVPGASVWSPGENGSTEHASMCYSQIINDTQNTTSFSLLGIIVLFIFGTAILVTSQFIEVIATRMERKFHWIRPKLQNWELDDKLQLQRTMLEERGVARWNDTTVPTTLRRERFTGSGGRAPTNRHNYSVVSNESPMEGPYEFESINVEPKGAHGVWYTS